MKQGTSIVLISCICFFYLTNLVSAKQRYSLDNFIVKENLIKNNKLAIIACDSLDEPTDQLNGTFLFVINGFKQQLSFSEGVAISPHEIDKSSFVFLKHKNEHGTHSKLYYVLKNDDGLKPIKINWVFLLLVPLAIVFVATIYKRLIFLAIIALIAFFYFNYNKGLSFEGLFETVAAGIKSFF
ncbi:hypothetical protein [Olivibacter sp. XZL3]|uniref:hypothetical protein n=1 Tax=Olivibacter sp. XZL3 TaxID=1735116 RepID=UPI001064973B|nr:hypothetical protein [Olivibacter sp. XZL3]